MVASECGDCGGGVCLAIVRYDGCPRMDSTRDDALPTMKLDILDSQQIAGQADTRFFSENHWLSATSWSLL